MAESEASTTVDVTAQEEREQFGREKPRAKDTARLIWASKPKKEPSPKDLEFQTAEEVYPNIADAGDKKLSSFMVEDKKISDQPNRLIWGDNLLVMQALLSQGYEGQIDLIYIDPPFNTGENFNFPNEFQLGDSTFEKELPMSERLAYTDTWIRGVDSFLDMLYPRLCLMRRLLSDRGCIFVHCDWHILHYLKVSMDEIFGKENFRNEISVRRKIKNLQNQFEKVKQLNVAFDSILWYSKNPNTRYIPPQKKIELRTTDQWNNFFNNADRPTLRYPLLGITLTHGQWRWTREKAEEAVKNYQEYIDIHSNKMSLYDYWMITGKAKRFIKRDEGSTRAYYWVEPKEEVPYDTDWTDIFSYDISHGAYPTQKAEGIISRIIECGSEKNSIVADFFCGSGTTGAVAEQQGRRWIMSDLSKTAIQVARGRLVNQGSKPFVIQNLGNYQRQLIYAKEVKLKEMYDIILKLYGATSRSDLQGFGISKDDKDTLVYVCEPDRPMTGKKAIELGKMAKTVDGKGYKRLIILAWDYDYDFDDVYHKLSKNLARTLVDTEFRIIPSDVYKYLRNTKTCDQELANKITFHEKPYLKLSEPQVSSQSGDEARVRVKIDGYVVRDIPVKDESKRPDIEKMLHKNFAYLVDYWTVDWDYDGEVFRSKWQAIREGNGSGSVPLVAEATLKRGKKFTIAVRVVDVFGNDASITKEIDLR